jgi:hypothetical protein
MISGKSMEFNGGNCMQTNLKNLGTALLTLLLLSSCGGKEEKKAPRDGTNLTDPSNKDGVSKSEACELGETRHADGSCVRYCRTASNGSEYCLRSSEMPSDIDPKKKVAACKYGIFDRDECKKVRFSYEQSRASLFAGDVLRARLDSDGLYLDRLTLGGYSGFGYELHYDYVTEFPRAALIANGFGNYGIYFPKSIGPDGVRIVANDVSSDPLGKAEVDIYGIKFEMGAMTKSDFSSLCLRLAALNNLPDNKSFKLVERDSYNLVCGETPPSISLQCEGSDCSISEVVVIL